MSAESIDGWRMPVIPAGFDALVACHYPGCFELDFVNESTHEFASESSRPPAPIPWPWKPGSDPCVADWRRLGIEVVDFTHLARELT